MKNKTKHIIKTIEPGSIAEELELEPGDELLRVNGEIIEDVFDYHFQTNDTYLELTIRKKDGEEWDLEIEKEYDEEIGGYAPNYDKDYDVEDYKLETLCNYYGIDRMDAHRALGDCVDTAQLFRCFIEEKVEITGAHF